MNNNYILDRIKYLKAELGVYESNYNPKNTATYNLIIENNKPKNTNNNSESTLSCYGCGKYGMHAPQTTQHSIKPQFQLCEDGSKLIAYGNTNDVLIMIRRFISQRKKCAFEIRLYCDRVFSEFHEIPLETFRSSHKVKIQNYFPIKSITNNCFKIRDYSISNKSFVWELSITRLYGNERFEVISTPWNGVNIWKD